MAERDRSHEVETEERRPVGVAVLGRGSTLAVVCSDGAVFVRNPNLGLGVWEEQPPVPGTPAARAREE